MRRPTCPRLLVAAAVLGAACTQRPAVVVVVTPTSGPLAARGEEIRRGADLAAELLVVEGGVRLALRHVAQDADPARGPQLVRREFESGAAAAIAGVGDEDFRSLAAGLHGVERAVVSPWGGGARPEGGAVNLFRLAARREAEIRRLVRHARRDMVLKDLVILHDRSASAVEAARAAAAEVHAHRGRVEWEGVFGSPLDDGGADARVADLRTRPGQGVILVADADDTVRLLWALRRMEYMGDVLVTSALACAETLDAAGAAAEGVVLARVVGRGGPVAEAFAAAWAKAHGGEPPLAAQLGHDAARAIAAAVTTAGGVHEGELARSMRSLRYGGQGSLGPIRFDAAGDAARDLAVFRVVDGRLVGWKERAGIPPED